MASQEITDISFAIDRLSNLAMHAKNPACAAVGNVEFNLRGDKLVGKDPNVYKYNKNFITDASGDQTLSNLEWDTYYWTLPGTVYDVAGSIPMLPLYLTPGTNQDLTVILRPHTNNSLLVKVQDAATGLPLSGATARLTKSGYDESLVTGLGYARQTDWSLGSGAAMFTEGRYYSDDGNIAVNSPAGDVKLKKISTRYAQDGRLDSATFDLGSAVNFNNVMIEPLNQAPPVGSNGVSVQIATSNSSSPASWNFTGPDGASSTFYTATNTLIYSGSSGKRYLRNRAYLHTDNTYYTAQLSEISFTYTNTCVPPGQSFFNSLSADTYTVDVSKIGYVSSSLNLAVAGNNDVIVKMAEE